MSGNSKFHCAFTHTQRQVVLCLSRFWSFWRVCVKHIIYMLSSDWAVTFSRCRETTKYFERCLFQFKAQWLVKATFFSPPTFVLLQFSGVRNNFVLLFHDEKRAQLVVAKFLLMHEVKLFSTSSHHNIGQQWSGVGSFVGWTFCVFLKWAMQQFHPLCKSIVSKGRILTSVLLFIQLSYFLK